MKSCFTCKKELTVSTLYCIANLSEPVFPSTFFCQDCGVAHGYNQETDFHADDEFKFELKCSHHACNTIIKSKDTSLLGATTKKVKVESAWGLRHNFCPQHWIMIYELRDHMQQIIHPGKPYEQLEEFEEAAIDYFIRSRA